MLDILIKASAFVLVVLLGYLFKIGGIISDKEGRAMAKVVMNVTLPCALLISAKAITITNQLIIPMLIALLANFVMLLIGYLKSRGKESVAASQEIIQLAGYNVGNFAFPFVQSFFPASYLLTVILFDIGNAIMVFGGNVSMASGLAKLDGRMTLKKFLAKLFHSVPFCTYLFCFCLALLHLELPSAVLTIAKIGADANPFMAMLVLGIMVDLRMNREEVVEIGRLLGLRLLGSGIMIALVYLLPVSAIVRDMLTICLLAPVAVVSPLFARELGSKSPIPATINSLTIITSIILITLFIMIQA
ncbi:permease [Streptococcus penaeicida]|uniref:Permease n=1 Tax=Streptococcus penaeicida TaxID=1765960 RepID=A0A2N8LBU3_9STRE|nr:permease [Streptococcus penaeicida]PND47629.1 permease [Streptococcus penaeicida]